jgi:hypothetical protein
MPVMIGRRIDTIISTEGNVAQEVYGLLDELQQ